MTCIAFNKKSAIIFIYVIYVLGYSSETTTLFITCLKQLIMMYIRVVFVTFLLFEIHWAS